MKLHIGVDSQSGLIHSVAANLACVQDSELLPELLHGAHTRVYGDSAYHGQSEVIRQKAPCAKDFTQEWAYRNRSLTEHERQTNRTKSATRAKVEHPFLVIKRLWGVVKGTECASLRCPRGHKEGKSMPDFIEFALYRSIYPLMT